MDDRNRQLDENHITTVFVEYDKRHHQGYAAVTLQKEKDVLDLLNHEAYCLGIHSWEVPFLTSPTFRAIIDNYNIGHIVSGPQLSFCLALQTTIVPLIRKWIRETCYRKALQLFRDFSQQRNLLLSLERKSHFLLI